MRSSVGCPTEGHQHILPGSYRSLTAFLYTVCTEVCRASGGERLPAQTYETIQNIIALLKIIVKLSCKISTVSSTRLLHVSGRLAALEFLSGVPSWIIVSWVRLQPWNHRMIQWIQKYTFTFADLDFRIQTSEPVSGADFFCVELEWEFPVSGGGDLLDRGIKQTPRKAECLCLVFLMSVRADGLLWVLGILLVLLVIS